MPTKLPNGSYRVQIRVSGFPTVDRSFNSLKAAETHEREEREKIRLGVLIRGLSMSYVDRGQRSGLLDQFQKCVHGAPVVVSAYAGQ